MSPTAKKPASRIYSFFDRVDKIGGRILETKASGDTHRKWAAVQRIVVSTAHVFVYTSGVEAFVIPRRAFDGESEFTAFVKYLDEHSSAELQNG